MPLGEFEVLILMAVLRVRANAYAPAVREEIELRTGRRVSRGAVYITLDRLETKGLLGSKLAAPGTSGRARRVYHLSPRGARALRIALAAFERMREGLEPALAES
jgi:DNA-binding PadR family transcriptional regulator